MRIKALLVAGFELGLLVPVLVACSGTTAPPGQPARSTGRPAPTSGSATVPMTSGTPVPGTTGVPDTSGPSQGSGPLPATCVAQPVTALCVTFNLTGATTVTGSNWVNAEIPEGNLPDSTCPEYGASTLESDEPGLPKVTKVIGSQSVEAAFGADKAGDGAGVTGAAASGSIVVDDVTYEAEDGTAKIDLNRDGSGKLVLPRLVGGSGSLSGSISWRCIDPKE
ncbi:hypothetical protein GCM10029976_096640 [Kribbella albertanoniae]|uniref:WxL domain-containing protein n=1 Tax=Kribbella albertanoniae TaxID=1266829 RepID=A0A4R4QFC5_9ACTN|nr:hypothetical protein [Kribbella albertanoniae]TDC34326.1 hypothetical protein E1261_04010 [Kribbella albertanoniae]